MALFDTLINYAIFFLAGMLTGILLTPNRK